MTYLSYWRAGNDFILQTDDPRTANRVGGWKFTRKLGSGVKHYLRLFILPKKFNRRARKALGLTEVGDIFRKTVKPGEDS